MEYIVISVRLYPRGARFLLDFGFSYFADHHVGAKVHSVKKASYIVCYIKLR